eukprot:5330032-Pleurochrysis_carterae.AAC.4
MNAFGVPRYVRSEALRRVRSRVCVCARARFAKHAHVVRMGKTPTQTRIVSGMARSCDSPALRHLQDPGAPTQSTHPRMTKHGAICKIRPFGANHSQRARARARCRGRYFALRAHRRLRFAHERVALARRSEKLLLRQSQAPLPIGYQPERQETASRKGPKSSGACACMRVRARACVCVRVRARAC